MRRCPRMPRFAAALFLARESLVEMDVPTRQSYVMAVVRPAERTAASGVTNVTRNIGWAIGPAIAGSVMMPHVALAGPLVIGGALKIGYDLSCTARFVTRVHRRRTPPAGEVLARAPGHSALLRCTIRGHRRHVALVAIRSGRRRGMSRLPFRPTEPCRVSARSRSPNLRSRRGPRDGPATDEQVEQTPPAADETIEYGKGRRQKDSEIRLNQLVR